MSTTQDLSYLSAADAFPDFRYEQTDRCATVYDGK